MWKLLEYPIVDRHKKKSNFSAITPDTTLAFPQTLAFPLSSSTTIPTKPRLHGYANGSHVTVITNEATGNNTSRRCAFSLLPIERKTRSCVYRLVLSACVWGTAWTVIGDDHSRPECNDTEGRYCCNANESPLVSLCSTSVFFFSRTMVMTLGKIFTSREWKSLVSNWRHQIVEHSEKTLPNYAILEAISKSLRESFGAMFLVPNRRSFKWGISQIGYSSSRSFLKQKLPMSPVKYSIFAIVLPRKQML